MQPPAKKVVSHQAGARPWCWQCMFPCNPHIIVARLHMRALQLFVNSNRSWAPQHPMGPAQPRLVLDARLLCAVLDTRLNVYVSFPAADADGAAAGRNRHPGGVADAGAGGADRHRGQGAQHFPRPDDAGAPDPLVCHLPW